MKHDFVSHEFLQEFYIFLLNLMQSLILHHLLVIKTDDEG